MAVAMTVVAMVWWRRQQRRWWWTQREETAVMITESRMMAGVVEEEGTKDCDGAWRRPMPLARARDGGRGAEPAAMLTVVVVEMAMVAVQKETG